MLLIIAKPSAIAQNMLGKIIQSIEKEGLVVAGMKMQSIDIHYLQNKLNREKREEAKAQIILAKKVPAVLIAAYGRMRAKPQKNLKKNISGNCMYLKMRKLQSMKLRDSLKLKKYLSTRKTD